MVDTIDRTKKKKEKKSGIFFQFDQVRNKFENFVVG